MAGKIFVNYRRDDDPSAAARVRDALAAKFGMANVFMDVDNLLAGQRFEEELAKALAQCDVLIAVVGARWMGLLKARNESGEHDYVRQEIAEALRRRLIVIPVRVGREGNMPPLPRVSELPSDIRDVVFYQKLDLAHERFGRDIEDLANAITTIRKKHRPQRVPLQVPWGWIGATAVSVLAISYAGAYYAGMPVPWHGAPAATTGRAEDSARAKSTLARSFVRYDGRGIREPSFRSSTVATRDGCEAGCTASKECAAYDFNRKLGSCFFYDGPVTFQSKPDFDSGVMK